MNTVHRYTILIIIKYRVYPIIILSFLIGNIITLLFYTDFEFGDFVLVQILKKINVGHYEVEIMSVDKARTLILFINQKCEKCTFYCL